MAHASAANNYDLFIVQSGIPQERMDRAAAWMERYPNATLRFIDIEPFLEGVRGTMPVTREYSVAVFYRIFAPAIFSGYERIVYLDSDVTVLGDIAELYSADLGRMPLGAVRDITAISQSLDNRAVAEYWRTRLTMEPGNGYFNSGVLVMALDRLRREDALAQFLARIGDLTDTKLPDQDLINAVLNGKIQSLPAAWNCFDWMADEAAESPNFRYVGEDFLEEARAARRGVKILHFTEKKPWTMEYTGKFAEDYWRHAAQTPFHDELLARIRRDSEPARILLRSLVTRFQEAHYAIKKYCVPGECAEKYLARIRNLRWKRKRLTRQREFIEALLQKEKSNDRQSI
jgi:lipopolysaccharide biosynthesis glycosyltransferase